MRSSISDRGLTAATTLTDIPVNCMQKHAAALRGHCGRPRLRAWSAPSRRGHEPIPFRILATGLPSRAGSIGSVDLALPPHWLLTGAVAGQALVDDGPCSGGTQVQHS
jgi:hypothetical protein